METQHTGKAPGSETKQKADWSAIGSNLKYFGLEFDAYLRRILDLGWIL